MKERLFKAVKVNDLTWITGTSLQKTMQLSETILQDLYLIDDAEVLGDTICDATGLLDKNNRPIFDSDIVIDDKGKKSIVVFNDGAYFYTDRQIRLHQSAANFLEVIGNQFDNVRVIYDKQ